MLKRDELSDPNSCWNRARDDEMMFILLARDADAPGTVLDWINRRVRSKKNSPNDPKLENARKCVAAMEDQQQRATYSRLPQPKFFSLEEKKAYNAGIEDVAMMLAQDKLWVENKSKETEAFAQDIAIQLSQANFLAQQAKRARELKIKVELDNAGLQT